MFKKIVINADGDWKLLYVPTNQLKKEINSTDWDIFKQWESLGNVPKLVAYVPKPEIPLDIQIYDKVSMMERRADEYMSSRGYVENVQKTMLRLDGRCSEALQGRLNSMSDWFESVQYEYLIKAGEAQSATSADELGLIVADYSKFDSTDPQVAFTDLFTE